MPGYRSFKSKSGYVIGTILALWALALSIAAAQVPVWDSETGCYMWESGVVASCTGYPGPGSATTRTPGPRIGYDPCYLAQNAMRPCSSDQRPTSRPVGVDAHLLGMWELPFKGGPWVLTIARDGTYKFHSEAHDGAKSHSGNFSAGNGRWSLKATTGYTDSGFYLYQAPDLWIATGKLGAAAWLRPELAQNAMRPCTSEQHQPSKPGTIDAHLVGAWKVQVKGGAWVWEILRDGTYKFHSEAHDGAPSHTGTFSASNGHWSLKSTTGYTDTGLYLYQAPDILMATGQLGAAAWIRPASPPISCNKAP